MTDDIGYIHRFLPGADKSADETLVVLHGTGGNENDLIGIGQTIAPGAAILSPRGNVLENGAPRFFTRVSEGVFDPYEVRSRAAELASFIRAAISKYTLNPDRIFAMGYSNGANVASTVMLTDAELLRGAILFRPMMVLEPNQHAALGGKGVFISAGKMDPIVPVKSVDRLVELLEASHADVTLKWQQAGHNLLSSEVREATNWLSLQRARV